MKLPRMSKRKVCRDSLDNNRLRDMSTLRCIGVKMELRLAGYLGMDRTAADISTTCTCIYPHPSLSLLIPLSFLHF